MTTFLVKPGAIVATAGIAMLIAFVLILIVFQVVKDCDQGTGNCTYSSTAPAPFDSIVQPAYLAISLLLVAGGVLMVRIGRRDESRKKA